MKQRPIEDDDYYQHKKGYTIFTRQYLLDKGYCCGIGCKNCPYDYKAVPEPKRSDLLRARKKSASSSDNSQ